MTDQPIPNSQPAAPQKRPARRAKRWPWVVLGTGLVVGGVIAYSPALFGGLLLARLGEQAGVKGGTISGPLWSPTIKDAELNLPGLTATAGQANVTATSVNPATQTAHVKVTVKDANVNLKLNELLSGQGGGASGGGGGWKVVIDAIDVQNTKLNVDGKGVNVPNVAARISRGENGEVLVHGRTPEGPLSSQVIVGQTAQSTNTFKVNIDADARIARHYWNGIESGRIKGQYLFGDGDVKGDLRVINATLKVPEAKFVTVTGVGGPIQHRGDKIAVKLSGQGWDGPITAEGGVDLKAEHWSVTADATPTMSGLARALNTTGEGDLKLRVTANGWSTIRVKGYVQGAGKFAGIPFRDGKAEYTLLNRDGQTTGQTNDLSFSAVTEMAGNQKLQGQWALGRAGTASLVGNFAGQALDIQTKINAKNVLALSGSALGGPLRGTFALENQQLDAVLNPKLAQAGARVALSGTPENLNIRVSDGVAGPFKLAGTGHFGKDGLQADFGTAKLNLNKDFKGTWALRGLEGAGLRLSGGGNIDLTGGDVRGDLQASVPGVVGTLRGPLNINYVQQKGTFAPSGQKLTWQGDSFRVQAADLPVAGGVRVSGDLRVTSQMQAFGSLTAVGNGYNLAAEARGQTASVRGTAGDVTILAETDLAAPYNTRASLKGTDISGTLSVQNGVRFTLNTLGERASGVLDGERLNATGRVNLAALRPLIPLKDLAGTLDLNLAGLGGTAQLNAQTSGAKIAGTLTRAIGTGVGGRVLADLRATLPNLNGETLTGRVRGQVYPEVQAGGTVDYMGQTLNAALSGPYGHLTTKITGRTGELSFNGVTVPGQAVNVTGTLTPALTASGTWGRMRASYDGTTGLVRLTGTQRLIAFGQDGQVQGRATWGPGFKGMVDARGVLDQYTVAVSGPWSRLNVLLTDGEGLRGVGTASLPAGKYDVDVSGPLNVPGQGTLLIDGNIQGTGASPRGTVLVTDKLGGTARVLLNGFDNLQVQAQNLTLAGQQLRGNLTAKGGILNGTLQAGPLLLVASDGRVRATGEFSGHQVVASGKLTLPATVSDLNMRVTGPYLNAQASGSVANLHGSVSLNAQSFGNDTARVRLPAQTFPLSGTLTGARIKVGGLTWHSGQWSGDLGLRYALQTQMGVQNGQMRLRGAASTLTAIPSGPLEGRLQVLPTIGGTLSTSLTPFMGLIPAEQRRLIVPGRLVAQVRATGANISLNQTRYLQEPLGLDAHVDWRSGVKVQGTLTHPGSRLPLVYDGQNLTIRGATLNAHALQPVLDGAKGQLNLDLSVPKMDFAQASGQARVDITAQGQRAVGNVSLRAGQLAADLQSNLQGVDVRVRGPIYPQANALLTLKSGEDNLRATLNGQASQTLTLRGSGVYSGEQLNFVAAGTGLTGNAARANITGTAAGTDFDLKVAKGNGAGLEAWTTSGTLNVYDLRPLSRRAGKEVSGTAKAQFSGRLHDFQLSASGTAQGATFAAKLNQGKGDSLAAWKTSGTVNIPDLKAFTEQAGQVNAAFEGTLADLRLNATGEAAGIKFSAPATFKDKVLRLNGAQARLAQGDVLASGTVFPKLSLVGQANVRDILPGQYAAQVTGTFNKPDVRLTGKLSSDLSGLQVAGTGLSARLLGQDWKATFTGGKLAGTARGHLGSNVAGGLLDATLKLNTAYKDSSNEVYLSGPIGWNAKTGWQGALRTTGTVPGGALDAILTGRGPLAFTGTLGTGDTQAGFVGELPAGLPLKPAGTVRVTRLDAGAFWGRPRQIQATGTATLGGESWNKVQGTFVGHIDDSAGELTGDVQASYAAGNVQASLQGEQVQGQATLRDGRYDATLKAGTLHLARLIPATLDVNALTFGGRAEVRGTLAGGPESVLLRNIALRGEQGQAGPFSLFGSAQYQPAGTGRPEVLEAYLRGSLRGGLISAQGALPAGLEVSLKDIPTNYMQAASFGVGKVNGQLHLKGNLRDPFVSGQLSALTDQLDANLTLSGQASEPKAHARVTLLGDTKGTLYAEASGLDLKTGTLRGKVYGTVQSGQNRADLDLAGVWPNLTGQVKAQVDGLKAPILLTGDGQGAYNVNAGAVGGGQVTLTRAEGFIPKLSGQLDLDALKAVEGGKGQALIKASVTGTLTNPSLSASVSTLGAGVSDVTLKDTTGTISATSKGLSATLMQAGKTVATLSGQDIQLTEVGLQAAGSQIKATGNAKLNGVADIALTALGNVQGNLKATYADNTLALVGNVASQGFNSTLNVRANQDIGWQGTAKLTGGPSGLLTDSANLAISGPLARPLLTGDTGLLGAKGKIVANTSGMQLRLVDGPGATASGAVELRPDQMGQWVWSGATSLSRPELSLSVTPTGPLADPQLLLSVRRGEWRASGSASKSSAKLAITDGEKNGDLTWNGTQAQVNLPGLDLSHLKIPGANGLISASGSINTSSAGNGRIDFKVQDFTFPQELPGVGLKPTGNIAGQVTLQSGHARVVANADLNTGPLALTAIQSTVDGQSRWVGTAKGTINKDKGHLGLDLSADATGLHGNVQVNNFFVEGAGLEVAVNGSANLNGQTFSAKLRAGNDSAVIDAEGGLADALPMLGNLLPLKATGDGYSAHAVFNDINVSNLKIAPNLEGQVGGEATFNDGGGTFFLKSDALTIGPKTLPTRIEGTLVSGSWRLRGFLGESEFTAGLNNNQEVFGQATLRALPLGAVLGAFAGSTPGEGVVTGIARFRFPLADPASGTATVVAERIRVSTTNSAATPMTSTSSTSTSSTSTATTPAPTMTETLTGSGSLDFANRELRNINVQLTGAGTWDVQGQYTREKVNLNAKFTDTTFTPVLQLIPGFADLQPSLKGTVTLSAAGTYDRPVGLLRTQNLNGSVAGLSLQIPQFSGDLPDSGAFSGGGRILTGGTVGTDGNVNIGGQLTLGKLSGTQIKFAGLLAPQALGALPNTTATISQDGEKWVLNAQSISTHPTLGGGTLNLSGTLSPKWDLNLSARNYNMPMSAIYAKESSLTGDLKAVDDGTLVHVSGAADFARLTLGRVNAPTTIPAPGASSTATDNKSQTVNYVSPLPEEYTTFPKPKTEGAEAEKRSLPFLDRLVFDDIRVRAPNGIRVDENLARAEFGTTGLTISGTGSRPRINGEILSQRGSIFLRENEFKISTGQINFGGDGLFPTFNIVANGVVPSSSTRQNVPITLTVSGDFRTENGQANVLHLDTRLSCTAAAGNDACTNPNTGVLYGENELYALLATGVPDLASLPNNLNALGSSALQTALNVFVLGEIERTLAKALGVDVFRLTPKLATDGSVSATFTVGSYITRQLFLQYQVDLSGNGLIGATYTTPDSKFTFEASTPLIGLNLQSIRPSFSAAYNVSNRASVSIGVVNNVESVKYKFGITYRIGAR